MSFSKLVILPEGSSPFFVWQSAGDLSLFRTYNWKISSGRFWKDWILSWSQQMEVLSSVFHLLQSIMRKHKIYFNKNFVAPLKCKIFLNVKYQKLKFSQEPNQYLVCLSFQFGIWRLERMNDFVFLNDWKLRELKIYKFLAPYFEKLLLVGPITL